MRMRAAATIAFCLLGCVRPKVPAKPPPRVSRIIHEVPPLPQWWMETCGAITPLQVGHSVTPPVAIRRVAPVYPRLALEGRITGIIIETVIDTSGRVCAARVVKGGPFAEAALAAVKQWEFRPAMKDGKPVAVVYDITVTFRIA